MQPRDRPHVVGLPLLWRGRHRAGHAPALPPRPRDAASGGAEALDTGRAGMRLRRAAPRGGSARHLFIALKGSDMVAFSPRIQRALSGALLGGALFLTASCGPTGTVSTIASATAEGSTTSGATTQATAAPAAAEATAAPAAEATATASAASRSMGDPSAPIKVVVYSDFQCPYCAMFAEQAMPEIKKNYIDTGKVSFEFRDFPLSEIHSSAVLAAHVANCAAVQGSFYPMHDRLFKGQTDKEWGTSNLSQDFSTMLGYARELKLDEKALQTCVQSQQFATQIESDYREGTAAGVQSTPSFTVNGTLVVGAQPYDTWKKTFDDELAKLGK
ncbi:DsbA family protein [Chloroflexia bacterium SDU3-3]|nr:DsbA family protein [Chloroflexia bacterium SDU3-3]